MSDTTTEENQPAVNPQPEEVVEVSPVVVQPGEDQAVSFGMVAAIAFVASAITAATMLVGYDHFIAKKVLSVDVKGFVDQQQELYLAGKVTDEQLKQNYANLKAVVESIPKNRIVLMGDAVLGGAEKLDISVTPSK